MDLTKAQSVLPLTQFNIYVVDLPQAIQNHVTDWSQRISDSFLHTSTTGNSSSMNLRQPAACFTYYGVPNMHSILKML